MVLVNKHGFTFHQFFGAKCTEDDREYSISETKRIFPELSSVQGKEEKEISTGWDHGGTVCELFTGTLAIRGMM